VTHELLARAQRATADSGIDALLITPGPDLRYLTGYDALPLERLTCLVLPANGDAFLVAPRLEVPAAKASPAGNLGIDIKGYGETDSAYAMVASFLSTAKVVGLDDHMPAVQVFAFRDAMPDVEQRLAGEVVHPLRVVKTQPEIDALQAAADAIDRVHARVPEWLRAGRTEREVGRDIADAIIEEGHVSVDFVIVGSGPNGASPHHEVSDRVIGANDIVVVDIGGTMPSGYCSDCTRMYALGTPPADFMAYYPALVEAQATSVASVRPGVTAESVDSAGRDLLTAAGYGEHFIHRTGHGIGLETHENPYIVQGNDQLLEPGMAFSVEPGVYLEGLHGARIEDIVVVTQDGVRALNRRPHELVIIEPA
jgi:Xaa-Pro aminopeptidase